MAQQKMNAWAVVGIALVIVAALIAAMWLGYGDVIPSDQLMILTFAGIVAFLIVAAFAILRVKASEDRAEHHASLVEHVDRHIDSIGKAAETTVPIPARAPRQVVDEIQIGEPAFTRANGQLIVALPGTRIWEITCEHCRQRFTAPCTLTVYNSAFAQTTPEACEKLTAKTVIALRARLARRVPHYPCPKCGQFQSTMVQQWRRRKTLLAAAWCAGVALFATGIGLKEYFSRKGSQAAPFEWSGVGLFCLGAFVCFILAAAVISQLKPSAKPSSGGAQAP